MQLPEAGSSVELGDYFGRVSWREAGTLILTRNGEDGDVAPDEDWSDFCATVEAVTILNGVVKMSANSLKNGHVL